jgi:tetratricopeptide (TPR) repeat protein
MRRRLTALSLLLLAAAPLAAQTASALDRGAQLVKDRKYAEAKQLLEPVAAAEPRSAPAAYWLARARGGMGDAEGSRQMVERAVALAPDNAEYHLYLGQVYGNQAASASVFSKLGLAKKCRAEFERAVSLDPKDIEARMALMDYYSQAPGFLGGSKEKALEQAQAIQRLNPYRGAFALATLDFTGGRPDDAIAALRALASAYPDSSGPVSQLAMLLIQRKQSDAAFAAVDGFLKRRPHDPAGLYALGRTAAVTRQRLDEGERALREYLAGPAQPDMSAGGPHWRLGMILEARGRADEARREYETAVRLEPRNTGMRKSLEGLKR